MTSDNVNSDVASASQLLAAGNIEAALDILHRIFDGKNPEIAVLLGYIYGEDGFKDKDEDKSYLHYISHSYPT